MPGSPDFAVTSKIATLKGSPLRCPIDPDSVAYGEEVRILLHGKQQTMFRIRFVVRGRKVHVVAVRHSAQRSLAEVREADDLEVLH